MESTLLIETSLETYIIFIPHLQSIKVAYSDEKPYVKFCLTNETIEIPVDDLWQVAKTKEFFEEKYEKDFQSYKKIQVENTNQITNTVLKLAETYIEEDKFNYRQSRLTYRQIRPELIKKFSSFVFNCLNYFWSNFGTDSKKRINLFSIPTVSEIDLHIEQLFFTIFKDIEGFDVNSLYKEDLIKGLMLKCEELCKPVLKPVRSSYKLSKKESYEAAMDFVNKINDKVNKYLQSRG